MPPIRYQGVLFRGYKPAATLAAIQSVEKTIGLPFPEDYREFLQRVNGGKPKPGGYKHPRWEQDLNWPEPPQVDGVGMFPRPNEQQLIALRAIAEVHANTKTPPHIDRFYHVGRGSESLQATLVGQQPISEKADVSSLVAVAFSSLACPIYMSLSKSDYGAIFQFDEEFDFDPGPETTRLQDIQDLRIASSFNDLLLKLFDPKPILKPGFTPTSLQLKLLRARS